MCSWQRPCDAQTRLVSCSDTVQRTGSAHVGTKRGRGRRGAKPCVAAKHAGAVIVSEESGAEPCPRGSGVGSVRTQGGRTTRLCRPEEGSPRAVHSRLADREQPSSRRAGQTRANPGSPVWDGASGPKPTLAPAPAARWEALAWLPRARSRPRGGLDPSDAAGGAGRPRRAPRLSLCRTISASFWGFGSRWRLAVGLAGALPWLPRRCSPSSVFLLWILLSCIWVLFWVFPCRFTAPRSRWRARGAGGCPANSAPICYDPFSVTPSLPQRLGDPASAASCAETGFPESSLRLTKSERSNCPEREVGFSQQLILLRLFSPSWLGVMRSSQRKAVKRL